MSLTFHSCLDLGCSRIASQRVQHLVNGDMAARLGGAVSFYSAEDPDFLEYQPNLRSKLKERPQVDGFIFFRLQQFNYGSKFDYPFLLSILRDGYEVHFACELFSLRSEAEFAAAFSTLHLFSFTSSSDGAQQIISDMVRAS